MVRVTGVRSLLSSTIGLRRPQVLIRLCKSIRRPLVSVSTLVSLGGNGVSSGSTFTGSSDSFSVTSPHGTTLLKVIVSMSRSGVTHIVGIATGIRSTGVTGGDGRPTSRHTPRRTPFGITRRANVIGHSTGVYGSPTTVTPGLLPRYTIVSQRLITQDTTCTLSSSGWVVSSDVVGLIGNPLFILLPSPPTVSNGGTGYPTGCTTSMFVTKVQGSGRTTDTR